MKLLIFTFCILTICLSGCDIKTEREKQQEIIMANPYNIKPYGIINNNYEIYISEIDKHEYLIIHPRIHQGIAITHKADCKFCKNK